MLKGRKKPRRRALALLEADERFSGYQFPPSELSTDPGGDSVAAAEEARRREAPKGVLAVGLVRPVDQPRN